MKMEYSELKEAFANFHAEAITKTDLIAAIGLYQRMNHIVTTRRVNGYRTWEYFSELKLHKFNYFPKNISPRIIGHNLDTEYEYEKEKQLFFDSVYGESSINPTIKPIYKQLIGRFKR